MFKNDNALISTIWDIQVDVVMMPCELNSCSVKFKLIEYNIAWLFKVKLKA